MSQKREKGYSQKGKPTADTVKQTIAAEDLEKAIHPTNRQNLRHKPLLSGFFVLLPGEC